MTPWEIKVAASRVAPRSAFHLAITKREKRMTKLNLLAAAVVLSSALAAPAMAQHRVYHPDTYAQSGYCAYHEPGNPYTKEEDYIAWSGWRARGGWDDRNDWNCTPIRSPHYNAWF
jgi:hypothetical protein